jgi:hypothetical protein
VNDQRDRLELHGGPFDGSTVPLPKYPASTYVRICWRDGAYLDYHHYRDTGEYIGPWSEHFPNRTSIPNTPPA